MVDPLNAGDSDTTFEQAEVALIVIAMVAPIFIFVVLIGPSRVVLLSLAAYAVFILLAVAITWLLDNLTATHEANSK